MTEPLIARADKLIEQSRDLRLELALLRDQRDNLRAQPEEIKQLALNATRREGGFTSWSPQGSLQGERVQ